MTVTFQKEQRLKIKIITFLKFHFSTIPNKVLFQSPKCSPTASEQPLRSPSPHSSSTMSELPDEIAPPLETSSCQFLWFCPELPASRSRGSWQELREAAPPGLGHFKSCILDSFLKYFSSCVKNKSIFFFFSQILISGDNTGSSGSLGEAIEAV